MVLKRGYIITLTIPIVRVRDVWNSTICVSIHISSVEFYFTRDGRRYHKYPRDLSIANMRPRAINCKSNCMAQVSLLHMPNYNHEKPVIYLTNINHHAVLLQ